MGSHDVLSLGEVQAAAAQAYEIFGELGRGPNGHPIYFAREKAPQGRLVLLDLRLVGRDPGGGDEYSLEFAGAVQAPGTVTGRICPSCGMTDPRSGRYCGRCRHNFAGPGGKPVQTRQELLEQVRRQAGGSYEILGEVDHATGRGIIYLARDRAKGELVALRLQQDAASASPEEFSLDVTRSMDALLASLVTPASSTGSPAGGRHTTFVRQTQAPPRRPLLEAPAEEAPTRRNWRRERSPRRARSAALIGLAVGVPLVAGGGVLVYERMRVPEQAVAIDTVVPLDTSVVRNVPPPPIQPRSSETPRDTSVTLRLAGLPPGATVTVDSNVADSGVARLMPGSHDLAIKAPGHRELVLSVTLSGDTVVDLTSDLAAVKIKIDPCRYPGERYNLNGECYDVGPRLAGGSTRVPLPPDFGDMPRPSILWVRIAPSGETLEVEPSSRSSPRFEEMAQRHADSLRWEPATKNGAPVAAWYEVEIRPSRR